MRAPLRSMAVRAEPANGETADMRRGDHVVRLTFRAIHERLDLVTSPTKRRGAVANACVALASMVLAGGAGATKSHPAYARPQLARSTPRVVIDGAGYKPRRFYPDNRAVASDFHWRVWSSKRAIGTGSTKTCAPGNVECSTVRQSMTYTRPRRICGHLTFTRFAYSKWPARGRLNVILPGICGWYTG
jgi:hypothetical protein